MIAVKDMDEVDEIKLVEKKDIERTLQSQQGFADLNFSMKHTRGAPELFDLSEESELSIRDMYLQSYSENEIQAVESEGEDDGHLSDQTKVKDVRWKVLKHYAMAPNFVISGNFNSYSFADQSKIKDLIEA